MFGSCLCLGDLPSIVFLRIIENVFKMCRMHTLTSRIQLRTIITVKTLEVKSDGLSHLEVAVFMTQLETFSSSF